MSETKQATNIKSTERVDKFGEVYTPENVVNDMLDLVGDDIKSLSKTVLEPSCGNGNFIVGILKRKFEGVSELYSKYPEANFDMLLIKAISTVYGIDIIPDNIKETKERMLNEISQYYEKQTAIVFNGNLKRTIQFIIDKNIILGDTLTQTKLKLKNERRGRTAHKAGYVAETEPDGDIMISEWVVNVKTGEIVRKVYCLRTLAILEYEYPAEPWYRLFEQREHEVDIDDIL